MDIGFLRRVGLPLIVAIFLLFMNMNSIINGVQQHSTWRICVASASSAIIILAFAVVLRNYKKSKKAS